MKAALLGALVMLGIDNGLGLLGLSSGTKFVLTGGVLLLAVTVDSISRRGARRRAGRDAVGTALHRQHQPELLAGARGTDEATVVAVASRDRGRAEGFAREHGIERAHGSYEALLEDPDVDAIYNPLPNAARAVVDPRARGGQARAVREADVAPPGGGRGGLRRGGAGRPRAGGGVHVAPPPADAAAARAARPGGDRAPAAGPGVVLVPARWTCGDIRMQGGLDGGSLMDVGCYCVSGARLVAGAEPERVHASR